MKNIINLVDAYGFVFRAYYALPPLVSPSGQPVGALYGFIQMLLKLMESSEPVMIVFDTGKHSFRKKIYDDYKKNRPQAPDDLIGQFSLVRKVCELMGFSQTEIDGFEADDIIATYAEIAEKEDYKVLIHSSDKDLMQLISNKVGMFDPFKKKMIEKKDVIAKFGVPPEKVIDILALMGDSSDNIPGIPGIGPKTAKELISEYGSVDNIDTSTIKQKRRRELLENNQDLLKISKELVTLRKDVPVSIKIDEIKVPCPDQEKLVEFLSDLGFKNIVNRIIDKVSISTTKHQIISSEDDLLKTYEFMKRSMIVAIHFNEDLLEYSTFKNSLRDKILSYEIKDESLIKKFTKDIIYDDSITKVGCEVKENIKIDLPKIPINDISLMSYIVYGGSKKHSLSDLIGEGKEQKTVVFLKIYLDLKKQIYKNKISTLYEYIERPLVNTLKQMEEWGIKIDSNVLSNLEIELLKKQKILEKEIYEYSNEEFNIASPKQLSEVLFEKLKLPNISKTKGGADSTDNEVLQKLAFDGYKIAEILLEWRAITKLYTTYTKGLMPFIKNDRIHTTFMMTNTITGRLSSVNPNLQNIPTRTDEGRKIRRAFIAEDGFKLVSFDYSQMELRLLAHIGNVVELIEAFKDDFDVHRLTASKIFQAKYDDVTSEQRIIAKTVNFGIIYGMGPNRLSRELKISNEEAELIIKKYFEEYQSIKNYIDNMQDFARKNGYVETLYGRKCFIPDINSKNYSLRGFAERQAINAPLQGSNADIIKMAMNIIHENIIQKHMISQDVRMLIQIHDELLFEIKEKEIEKISKEIIQIMENVPILGMSTINVPIKVDIGIGDDWANCK